MKQTKGWIINEALRQFISQEDRKLKMLEETEEAIADIEASRLISGEEVRQWLEIRVVPKKKLLHGILNNKASIFSYFRPRSRSRLAAKL